MDNNQTNNSNLNYYVNLPQNYQVKQFDPQATPFKDSQTVYPNFFVNQPNPMVNIIPGQPKIQNFPGFSPSLNFPNPNVMIQTPGFIQPPYMNPTLITNLEPNPNKLILNPTNQSLNTNMIHSNLTNQNISYNNIPNPMILNPNKTFNKYPYQQQVDNPNSFNQNNTKDSACNNMDVHKKGTELFIGNLSLETVESDLLQLFSDCGEVIEVRIHKQVQVKKCYAFVRFQNKDQMRNALDKNGVTLKGRKLKITKSNENSTIFIGNIRKNWINEEVEIKVKRIFPNCERIEHFPDPIKPKKNRGFCFVVFKNRNDAIRALNYVNSRNGINIDGIPLTCDWADVVDEDDSNSKQVFISGLNENVSEEKIREVFSQFGNITEIILSKNHKNSKRKDLGFVTFNSNFEAKLALEAIKNNNYFDTPVNVSLSFSQQVMQAKKRIKDNRRKGNNNQQVSSLLGMNFNNNFGNLSDLVKNNQINQNVMNSIISMLSANKNVNPTIMAQMMAVAVGMILNQNKSNSGNTKINNTQLEDTLKGLIPNTVESSSNNVIAKKKIVGERKSVKSIKSKGKIRLRNKNTLNNRVNLNSTSNNNNLNNNLNADNS